MAARHTQRTHTQQSAVRSNKSPRRSGSRSATPAGGTRRLPTGDARRLRVSAAEAHRLRTMLLSDEVGLIGSQDIHKLVTILEDVYPVPYPRRAPWKFLLLGVGLGLILLAAIMLVS